MTLPNSFPSRIWVCPGCEKQFRERWLLARHLRTVHRLLKHKADEVATQYEYILSPRYLRRDRLPEINPDDYYPEDRETE